MPLKKRISDDSMFVLSYPGPRRAEMIVRPRPRARGKISVAKTLATNVSAGTEMAFYRGTAPQFTGCLNQHTLYEEQPDRAVTFPMRADAPGVWWMGYAAVGRVIEVGPDEPALREGDLAFTEGGHKEYQAGDHFYKLPPDTDPARASLLMLMRIAFNAILDAHVKLMDRAVVLGMGTLGQLLLQMCKLSGAHVTAVDCIPARLNLAQQLGADAVFNPAADGDLGTYIQDTTQGKGAEVVLEASGNANALSDAIRCCGQDGQVTVVSFYQTPAANLYLGREFHHKRIILRSSQVGGVAPEFAKRYNWDSLMHAAIALLPKLNLDPLITHRVPFEQLPDALAMIDQTPQDCLAVVVEYE